MSAADAQLLLRIELRINIFNFLLSVKLFLDPIRLFLFAPKSWCWLWFTRFQQGCLHIMDFSCCYHWKNVKIYDNEKGNMPKPAIWSLDRTNCGLYDFCCMANLVNTGTTYDMNINLISHCILFGHSKDRMCDTVGLWLTSTKDDLIHNASTPQGLDLEWSILPV